MPTETRESMLNRAWQGVEEGYQEATQSVGKVCEQTEQQIQEAPITASLVSFGVGIGLGLLVTSLLAPQRRQRQWYDAYLGPDRASQMEQMMHRYVPDSVTRRFGH